MASKSIAVRLVAQGGNAVKATLQGIGDAGSRGFQNLRDRVDEANTRLRDFGSTSSRVAGVLRNLAGGFAAAFSVASIARMSGQYTVMTNSLRVLGFEQAQAAAKLREIGEVASRTRSPLEGMVQLYQRITVASRELGASEQDVLRFTENIGLALGQQGGAASEASGALLQLSQAIAGGTVRAEEFNSILEGAYPIALAAAKGIDGAGGSVARLRQMVIDGEVSSREFFTAILSQTDELEKAFANTEPTVGSATQKLVDSATIAIGTLDQLFGVSATVARGIEFLAENMDQAAGFIIAAAGATAVYYLPTIIAATRITYGWVASLVTLRGALLATGIGALVVGAGLLINLFIELVQTTGSVGAAFTTLGELAGLVWDGIVKSAAAIPPGLRGVWALIQADFFSLVGDLQQGWYLFLGSMASGLRGVGLDGAADSVAESAREAGAAWDETFAKEQAARQAANDSFSEAGTIISDAFAPAVARLQELRQMAADAAAATGEAVLPATQLTDEIDKAGGAAKRAGAEGKKAGKDIKDAAEQAAQGWIATARSLAEYVEETRDLAKGVGNTIVDGFRSAEDAVSEFVKTGKLSFTDMVTSMIADLARLAARRYVLGPLASGLQGVLGGLIGGGDALTGALRVAGLPAISSFDGGGHTGFGARVGGLDGRGGYLAMVHPQERITDESRGGARRGGDAPVVVNIQTRDAASFRQSRGQVAADLQRAVSLGRRNA